MIDCAAPAERKVLIVQGEYKVSANPEVVLTTLLGSCVAMCLRDPAAGVGGMNHFLLPGGSGDGDCSIRYGAHAMEVLVNNLLARGARRARLEAKLFGGARMLAGLTDMGEMNASFAEQYLRRENIAYVGGSLRGERGRRIQFWPCTGRTRQLWVSDHAPLFAKERHTPLPAKDQGVVELF